MNIDIEDKLPNNLTMKDILDHVIKDIDVDINFIRRALDPSTDFDNFYYSLYIIRKFIDFYKNNDIDINEIETLVKKTRGQLIALSGKINCVTEYAGEVEKILDKYSVDKNYKFS